MIQQPILLLTMHNTHTCVTDFRREGKGNLMTKEIHHSKTGIGTYGKRKKNTKEVLIYV